MKERIEEESEKKSDGLKALSKAQAEIQLWKSKFETEGLGRIEELESGKQRISARLMESEETIENLDELQSLSSLMSVPKTTLKPALIWEMGGNVEM